MRAAWSEVAKRPRRRLFEGELGDATNLSSSTAVAVQGLTGVTGLGIGPTAYHALAPLGIGQTLRFKVAGQTFAGLALPTSAKVAQLNVTAVPLGGFGGSPMIFPGDAPDSARPLASALNPVKPINYNLWSTPLGAAGTTVNGLPAAGTFAAYSSTVPVDLIVDVTGYYQ